MGLSDNTETLYRNHALDDPEYAQYVYSQSNKKQYERLDIYRLCRKVIHKSLVFDVSNALYSLNHNNSAANNNINNKLNTIEEISLCDVKCLTQELYTFLNNNATNLHKNVYVQNMYQDILQINIIIIIHHHLLLHHQVVILMHLYHIINQHN